MSGSGSLAAWRRRGIAAALALAAAAAGCSDDVVCPVDTAPDLTPFVSARVVEATLARGDTTWAQVSVTADSLPSILFVSINDRQIDTVTLDEDFGLVVSLEEDVIVWQPGTRCSLKVTTNYGFATSSEVIPSGFAVAAPETVLLGEPLVLRWFPADNADYYRIRWSLGGAEGECEITATVRDTSVTIEPEEIPFAGIVQGYVEAVAGPFPETGTEGNIGGAGWGFFTAAYRDPASAFEVAVADTNPRRTGPAHGTRSRSRDRDSPRIHAAPTPLSSESCPRDRPRAAAPPLAALEAPRRAAPPPMSRRR